MFLGIDLGTSELKLLLLSEAHRIEATASAPLAISRPAPRWSEQDPEAWWQALDATMMQLAAGRPQALKDVRAIGLSGQMHGAVLLDRNDAVLRPAILWNDGRSDAECEALTGAVPELAQITGNLAMPGFTAPKLQWVRAHEPEIFARTARVLLPKDFLRLRLTGEAITDCSDASGTLWLDVGRRVWSEQLLAATGLTIAHMPSLVEGSEPAGRLRPELARRWGLGEVIVAGGGGDNAASAVGIGAIEPGQGFVSLGTSGVVFIADDRFLPNPASAVHAFCHALPGRWHRMSVMLSASSCLVWAARLTGQPDVPGLLALAATTSASERATAPLFLPYLSGERTPHNDAAAQGVLFGLGHGHGPAAVAWSVIEGVGFGLLDGLDALTIDGRGPASLDLVGGGARSALWAQWLATALNVELVVRRGGEAGAALGAARLGWLACGGTVSDVCRRDGETAASFKADAAARLAALPRYERFKSLYRTLRSTFAGTARG